jgi:hypothetical protein
MKEVPRVRAVSAVVVAAVLLLGASTASAHLGNPNYRSEVERVTPALEGVDVSVLDYDDRLLLQNTTGRDVVVMDYAGKPYARLLADRTVEVNTNSSAYYLNDDRYGQVTVPDGLGSTPRWKEQSRSGRFEWHDHRMHWMGKGDPPALTDKNRRTHIFDWKVPITVGGTPGTIAGSLTWVPLDQGSAPMGLIWGSTALLVLLSIAVVVIRRRRAAAGHPEAW